jgi:integrase
VGKLRKRRPCRRRIGRVSIYPHRRRWWVYYREHGVPVRRAVADDETTAAQVAAQINLELTSSAPTLLSFRPISVAELQRTFVDYHEHVLRSSLATVCRYRSATRHLANFCGRSDGDSAAAHQVDVEGFVRYLRGLRVAPNGHPNTRRRTLRDKGVQYVLETCRSMYGYAAKRRHLPPYTENPFAGLGGKRLRIEDAKPIFVFDETAEYEFLRRADEWAFPVHFLLAKTGVRTGELTQLLIEDVDLAAGWLYVRSRPELGAQTKTRRERAVPLIAEIGLVLGQVMGGRAAGPVVLRHKAQAARLPLFERDSRSLARATAGRIAAAESAANGPLDRRAVARIQRQVWREAGATCGDRIRQSYIHTAVAADFADATCPKSWRHTFATLLQDANVDPLVRQLTLGHAPSAQFGGSALGMTSIYTHTRPATQQREIERALRLWPRSLQLARQRCGDP